ncbi:MAG TPA: hypothetical protein VFX53_05045 [Pedococcus sp.]|nr:hypothetical protein [Pedococcus sp.]
MSYGRAAAAMVGAAVMCMFPVVLGLVKGQPWTAAIGAFAAGFLLATARGFWQRRDRANQAGGRR